jgi:hypothetical protein
MKVICTHCSLPFSVRRVVPEQPIYCCSGCALAARVPVDAEGNYPINAAAVTATSLAFVAFNQGLFWMMALLLGRAVEPGTAQVMNAVRFTWASFVVAVLLWGALAVLQARVGARRGVDGLMVLFSGAMIGYGALCSSPVYALIGNGLLSAWALRGLRRAKLSPAP